MLDSLNEKYLFEFVNRIGAFITYIFLESMRPYEYNIRGKDTNWKIQKRKILADNLLRRAIDIKWMYETFRDFLYITEQIGNVDRSNDTTPLFIELNAKQFENLISTFRKVYPGIYDALEEYWQKEVHDQTIIFSRH